MNKHIEVSVWRLEFNVPGGNWALEVRINRDLDSFGSTEQIRKWAENNGQFFPGDGTYFVTVVTTEVGNLKKGSCQATIVEVERDKIHVESPSVSDYTQVRK